MTKTTKEMIKSLTVLALVIIGCALLARFLMRGETLAEYAAKNPPVVETDEDGGE